MKTALLSGVFAAALLIAAAPAKAAEPVDYDGFYLSGFGVYNYLNGNESTPYLAATGATVGANSEIEYEGGWGGGAALGWSWGNGLRTELEYAYRTNDVEDVDPGAAVGVDGGEITLQTIMVNAAYDLPVLLGNFARPYAGVGLGYGMTEYNQIGNLGGFTIDDDGNGLAYQGFVGLGLQFTDRLQGLLEYRYVGTDEHELATDVAGVESDLGYNSHNVLVGLRYQFGDPVTRQAPPPAPAPMPVVEQPRPMPAPRPAPAPVVMPAPAVPQTYIVFFDFDKSVITPEAQRVLERAAADVRVGQGARIHVIGHADRAGSPRYNVRLSERRATVVRNELINLGVTSDQIETKAMGETQNRVPTADGVREAQNRRAEIIFQ